MKITKTTLCSALPLAAALLASTALHGAPVIYEPFAYAAGGLNGNGGTSDFGFDGNWSANAASLVVATNLQYGSLATTGGSIGGLGGSINRFGGARACAAALASPTDLLADGTTLWFSVIVGYETGANNTRLGFALANSSFNTGNFQYYINNEGPQLGTGVGFSLSGNGNGVVNATHFRDSSAGTNLNGIVNGNTSGTMVSNGNPPRLLVGTIEWGATEDVITIYAPNSSLDLGTAISTLTVNVDQSTFDTITWARGDRIMMDEIRFGATSSDVMPLDTVAPSLVSITDDQAGGPVGEDLAAITYALTFDRPMDLTTITEADFDTLGTASTTIGSITQPSPNLILVQVLPTTTGTVQLRIPSGSVLSSFVPLDLDTTAAILDDTTITINEGSTPDTGIRYWDGSITSGITDGVSTGGNGTWNTTITNWDRGAGIEAPVAWNNANNDTAILGGANGTVTLGEPITVGGLQIDNRNIDIVGSSTLTFGVAGVINSTSVGSQNDPPIISSKISGAAITKTGAGYINLNNNDNDFAAFTLSAGTLGQLPGGTYSGIGTGLFTINGGGFFVENNNQTTINNDMVWNGNWFTQNVSNANKIIEWNGDVSLGADVTVSSKHAQVFNGDISETGGARKLTLTNSSGSSTVTLAGDNSFSGGVQINQGTLNINSATALGTGTFTINVSGAVINNTSDSPITLSTDNVQDWNQNFTFTGSNNLNLGTGTVTMNNNRIVTVSAGTLTIGGNIDQSGGTRTLGKAGGGTLELSGANTYAGNTTVTAGTLALVGGSQNSAITVNSGATLGFTLGSPTTSTKALTLSGGHAIAITGSVNNASDYQLMTASAITGTPALSAPITDYELELQNGDTELWLVYTGIAGTPYETWAATFLPDDDVSNPADDNDNDGLNNLREYAFGTDPTTSFTGPMVYTAGGDVTTTGQPILLEEGGTYYAVFGRRKDYVAAGLTYTVQFSADLTSTWFDSPTVPTVVTGDPSSGDIEAVSVPFPGLIPTDSGPLKATFFRLQISTAP